MRKFKRGHAEVRGIVDAPIDQVWELLTDWAGLLRWWVKPEDGGRPGPDLASVDLVGGPQDVPRTRVVRHVTGSTVDETLLLQNDETRRIYYDMVYRPNPGGAVLRSEFENYLATTVLDTLPASVPVASTVPGLSCSASATPSCAWRARSVISPNSQNDSLLPFPDSIQA